MRTKQRVIAEEKSVYGEGHVDEGNWFCGQFTADKGRSWGTLECPLSFLPSALQRRAVKGQSIHLRINIADDGELRVVSQEHGPFKYTE